MKLILKRQESNHHSYNNISQDDRNKLLSQKLEQTIYEESCSSTNKAGVGRITAKLLNLELIKNYGYNCKILKEISLQLKVHTHPNVLSIYKVYDSPSCLFVVMDYYEEGDLFKSIVDKKLYEENPNLVKNVFIQLLDALSFCHANSVYHCDLKPENILVLNNGTKLVIADFGLALQEEFISSSVSCGSSYYMAPERVDFQDEFDVGDGKTPTSVGDVWSLLIILINLISIRNPWLKLSLKDHTFNAYLKDHTVLLKILPLSDEVFKLLSEKYLVLNPLKRHSLMEFRQDIINVKKFSNVGPLSVDCEETFLDHNCLIPFDHVVNNGSYSLEKEEMGNNCPISLPKNHPNISKMLEHQTIVINSSTSSASDSSSISSISSSDIDYDDDDIMLVETPPTTYPSSPVFSALEDSRYNLTKMLNDINADIKFNSTTATNGEHYHKLV